MAVCFDRQLVRTERPAGIVYPASSLAAYGIIRSLGEQGIQVFALNPYKHPHLKSRWATPVMTPHLAQEPEAFIEFLNEMARQLPMGGVLYVLEEVDVYLIHRHRHRLHPAIRTPLADAPAVRGLFDKRVMLEAAAAAGVPIPETFYPASLAELDELYPRLAFPALIKPLVSRFNLGGDGAPVQEWLFHRHFGGRCLRADDYARLREGLEKALALGIPVCVQAFIDSPMRDVIGVDFYADHAHRLRGYATGRRLRQYPVDFGRVSLRGGVKSEAAVRQAADLVRALRFRGMGSIEFRTDPRSGELKLMAINPRAGAGFAPASGVDLPYLQYADLCGLPLPACRQDCSVRWFDGHQEWAYYRTYRKQSASPYHLALLPWLVSLIWAKPSLFNWRDPLPALLKAVPPEVWEVRQHWRARRAAAIQPLGGT